MRKLLVEIGLRALSVLLRKSIRNEALLAKLMVLLNVVVEIVEVLTDDDLSNDGEVSKVFSEGVAVIRENL
jgi:hypothetical protein